MSRTVRPPPKSGKRGENDVSDSAYGDDDEVATAPKLRIALPRRTRLRPRAPAAKHVPIRLSPLETRKPSKWDERITKSKTRQLLDRSAHTGTNDPLVAVYSDPKCIAKMLKQFGVNEDDAGAVLFTGERKYFNCALRNRKPGARATVFRGKNGQFVYAAFRAGSKDPRPVVLTLAEVYGNQHGYDFPSAALTCHPHVLGTYRGKLAVESGAFTVHRTPLACLPETVTRQIESRSELHFVGAMVDGFGLRIDLANNFTPTAYAKAGCVIQFSEEYRRYWYGCARDALQITEVRQQELWKVLTKASVIVQERRARATYHRLGSGRTVPTLDEWLAVHNAAYASSL